MQTYRKSNIKKDTEFYLHASVLNELLTKLRRWSPQMVCPNIIKMRLSCLGVKSMRSMTSLEVSKAKTSNSKQLKEHKNGVHESMLG